MRGKALVEVFEAEAPRARAVFGFDLSLRRPGFCFLPPWWHPQDPWSGVEVEAVEEEKDAGATRLLRIVEAAECFIESRWLREPRSIAPACFVEQHAFGMSGGAYALERAELVGAVKVMVRMRWTVETIPIVAASARKLLLGPQRRMSTREWKPFIQASFREMGAPEAWGEDERDAACIANAGRHAIGLPCLAFG